MWNPKTNGVVTTRDVIWLKQLYFEKPSGSQDLQVTSTVEQFKENTDSFEEIDEKGELESDTGSVATETMVGILRNQNQNDAPGARESDETDAPVTVTRYGREVRPPKLLMDEQARELRANAIELKYLGNLAELDNLEIKNLEIAMVGAGIGGGFTNTKELKVMNYKQAMASPRANEWKNEVKNEFERFQKFKAFTVVPRAQIPKDAILMSTTWAMKTKSNGSLRGRLNARGFEQVDGEHYFSDSIAAPVSNPSTIRVAWVLWCSNPKWIGKIVDVEGAFLQGQFRNGEIIYTEVPEGMEEFYGKREDVVLKMNVPIYGTKQAAACYYKTMIDKIKTYEFERSKADPCLYFKKKDGRLLIMVSWVDDFMVLGEEEDVDQVEKDLSEAFSCKPEGELKEYVGNKVEIVRSGNGLGVMKVTQPVLIQKLRDEYEIDEEKAPRIPAAAGSVLVKGVGGWDLDKKESTKYRSGTAVCMYIMQWSRPDIFNAVRNCARHMSKPNKVHQKALKNLMSYVVATKNRGLVLKPD